MPLPGRFSRSQQQNAVSLQELAVHRYVWNDPSQEAKGNRDGALRQLWAACSFLVVPWHRNRAMAQHRFKGLSAIPHALSSLGLRFVSGVMRVCSEPLYMAVL